MICNSFRNRTAIGVLISYKLRILMLQKPKSGMKGEVFRPSGITPFVLLGNTMERGM
ncbi:MAG: hypothetical protein BWY72_02292 [Bacteroidetes bacterium ADurb.Bin416]|nr:MAG: hypothetical protein BWY72_02292 [Bacteroidetes bacterium ADurb.Bin416]